MASTRKPDSDTDKVRGVLERWDDIERVHGGAVRIVIHRSVLPRRLAIRGELCDRSGSRLASVRIQVKADYPNGDYLGFVDSLYKLLHELDAACEPLPIERASDV